MKNLHRLSCSVFLLFLVPAIASASGYRIPEQSLNSVATSAAYGAAAGSADASFFNPANMSWLDNRWQADASVTYINLPRINYTDARTSTFNGSSSVEQFLVPNLHGVTPDYNNFRFGISMVAPAGLSKRWEQTFPKLFAEEFSLQVFELNPTVAYKFNDTVSIGGGIRLLRADGVVKSQGTIAPPSLGGAVFTSISRDLEGDTTEFGYNLAMTVRPAQGLALAATYRSKVDLDIEGDATLTSSTGFLASGAAFPALPAGLYSGYASVSVPVPAVLTLAVAYTFNKTTLEISWDRTYWDAYEDLDFNYSAPLAHPVLKSAFDDAKAKNWKNCDAFRIGLTHALNDSWTVMLGFAIDENPVPDNTLSFELPDSDSLIYSLGFRYKASDTIDAGAAYLLSDRKSRTVNQTATGGSVNGTFTDAAAHLFVVGMTYRF